LRCLYEIEPGRERRDLVLVEPAAQVARAPEAAADHARDAPERLVRAGLAEHVLVVRVAVEIEDQEAQAARFALRETQAALEELFEIGPAQQAGEFVVAQVGEHRLRAHRWIARLARVQAQSIAALSVEAREVSHLSLRIAQRR